MNDVKNRLHAVPDWISLALGAVLFLFSNGRWAVAPLAWVAPIPILAFLRGRRSSWSALALLPFSILAAWIMLRGIIPPWLGATALRLTAYFGLVWWLPYMADSLLYGRLPAGFRTVVFPAALTAVEYLSALNVGDWGSAAFSQAENLALLQVVSLAGIWGISFLVGWAGSLGAALIREDRGRAGLRRATAAFAAVMAVTLAYGGARLSFTAPGRTVRVGSLAAHEGEAGIAGLPDLVAESRKMAACGARIVFWPESLVDVSREEAAEVECQASRLARELGIHFMPAFHLRPDGAGPGSQRCAMFAPNGDRLWEYLKSFPVPGSPDEAGDGRVPIADTPYGRLGAAICYDFDFPGFIRQAGRKRVDIMLDPSWDWREIDPLHTRMAVVRAVENGFSLVRHTMKGLSLAVDPLGRTRAWLDHYKTRERRMVADVPARGMRTFYAWAGDWLPWACMLCLLCCCFLARRVRSLSAVIQFRRPRA